MCIKVVTVWLALRSLFDDNDNYLINSFLFLFFQGPGAVGGYNGLSSIKMEQDGMPPISSMKVGQNNFHFPH